MPLPRGLLKRLIREGYPAKDAMREAWRRVKKNPGATWHGHQARVAEVDRSQADQRGSVIGSFYYKGKRDAHRESQTTARLLGQNPNPPFQAGLEAGAAIISVLKAIAGSANPLTRRETGAILKSARTSSRLARKGGRSPRQGTESARDYFTGRRDALVDVARGFGKRGRRHRGRNPRGSKDILLIKPTGDPYGRGWEGLQSTDGGQTWFYRGDVGRQSRAWWRAYARRMGYTLRIENPLTRPEAAGVIRSARTQYATARQMKKGGPSRAYYMGAGDGMLSVARTHGPARTRIPRRTMRLNAPRLVGPIPGKMMRIEYRRTQDRPGLYYHNFKRGVRAYALSDGSVLLRGPKPLYVNQ